MYEKETRLKYLPTGHNYNIISSKQALPNIFIKMEFKGFIKYFFAIFYLNNKSMFFFSIYN